MVYEERKLDYRLR